jgi:SLT domain-containing protein
LIPEGPFPYAGGTDFARGGWSLVGERGPEVVHLPRGAQVIPNSALHSKAGRTINVTNYFTISGPVDRRTQDQIAAASLDGLRRGTRIR